MKNSGLDGLPDHQLIEMFLSRKEKEVFEVLYERYKNMIYAFVRKTLYAVPEDLAGDIMHEIFIKVYFELRQLKNFRAFRVWLFKLARTTCLKFIRSNRIIITSLDEERNLKKADGLADRRIDLEDDYIQNEIREAVFHEINRLPAGMREMIALKLFQKLTYEEISDIFKLSVRTVKYKISRAIDVINGKLRKEGYIS